MKNEKTQTFFDFFNSPQVVALITVGGLLVALLNLYLVAKLSPLATAIDSLEARADHTDSAIISFIPRAELEAMIVPIREDVVEIKQSIRRIEDKLYQP